MNFGRKRKLLTISKCVAGLGPAIYGTLLNQTQFFLFCNSNLINSVFCFISNPSSLHSHFLPVTVIHDFVYTIKVLCVAQNSTPNLKKQMPTQV